MSLVPLAEEEVKLSHDEIKEMLKRDLESGRRIRPLTKQERSIYGNAALNATMKISAFSRAISLLHPFVDATAETCYVDIHGRVGLSYFFLYAISPEHRVTWLTHEAMHVLNSHFVRAKNEGMSHMDTQKCGDFEINTTLSSTTWAKLDNLLLPENYGFEKYKTMEYYFARKTERESSDDVEDAIPSAGGTDEGAGSGAQDNQEDGNGDKNTQDSSSSGSGDSSDKSNDGDENSNGGVSGNSNDNGNDSNGGGSKGGFKSFTEDLQERFARDLENGEKGATPAGMQEYSCDSASEAREDEADEAGIERNSNAAQELARQETRARIKQEIENSKSQSRYGSGDRFYDMMISLMSPPKVDWRDVLRSVIAKYFAEIAQGKDQESFTRTNRRYSGEIIFPGRVSILPTCMMGLDTSGSMGQKDTLSALTEAKEIVEKAFRSRKGIPFFAVDTEIKNVQYIKKISDIKFQGGGGTDMSIAFKYINELPKRKQPDLFVLATDGHVFWGEMLDEMRKSKANLVILVTNANMDSVPPEAHRYAKIIPIGDENSDA